MSAALNEGAIKEESGQIAIDDLYPALVQCFGTIACGYIAGRLKIITNADVKGLNTFVGTFALPSLIFTSLVQLNWSTVNYMFLLAILIAKCVIFFGVGIVSLLMTRPLNYGRAGILAIFCTQSNDFAIGWPILQALYHRAHPEYASYLYLMAPLSLAILNPIGYVFLEFSSVKRTNEQLQDDEPNSEQLPVDTQAGPSKMSLMLEALKSIVLNPILFMTVFGVIGGFCLHDGMPVLISGVLDVFGKSFSATALFLLGLRIVDSTKYFCGPKLLTPIVLIMMKELALPLVIRQTINILNPGANYSETTDLSTFGFLYGTFPSAPGAFVIATKYDTDVDLIASSMVACTFVSGPIIYISSKMISLTNLKPADYFHQLESFAFDISVIGILLGIVTLLLFIITKKHKKMPHKITCFLLISQIIECVGVILWSYLEINDQNNHWSIYVQFVLYTFGSISSRLWCGICAVSLLFIQYRSLCFVLKLTPLFVAIGWGIPAVIVGGLLVLDSNGIVSDGKRNPNFQYGNAQAAISLFLLVIGFIVTLGCLVLHQRYKRRVENYLSLTKDLSSESVFTKDTVINNEDRTKFLQENERSGSSSASTSTNAFTATDIEDIVKPTSDQTPALGSKNYCSTSFGCSGSDRQQCHQRIEDYRQQQQQDFIQFYNDTQSMRHTVALILLLCSMFVSISLSVWTLIMEGMSGIYIELSFLEAFLNFGQVILVAACFITDTDELWKKLSIIIDKFRRRRHAQPNVTRQRAATMDHDARVEFLCEQFVRHHLENCKLAIGSDRFANTRIHKEAFYGTTFVNWLIAVGLATDRRDAVNYASYLIDGNILHHINDVKKFYDRDIIYCFNI